MNFESNEKGKQILNHGLMRMVHVVAKLSNTVPKRRDTMYGNTVKQQRMLKRNVCRRMHVGANFHELILHPALEAKKIPTRGFDAHQASSGGPVRVTVKLKQGGWEIDSSRRAACSDAIRKVDRTRSNGKTASSVKWSPKTKAGFIPNMRG
ncbi:hypothetical protein B0H17DRAFT_1134007 [Mycena rosella]|uniref:Uncharacterized protein n=1 Tax=Mycena rosella TaxID=1033263 RepID=A0AAD7DHB4_MYCRO|nr:hypothetical protein B0H17DRAFT_1134007 [Mycena rosella]